MSGLRLLKPLLTPENHRALLAEAAGKSKRDIEHLVARIAPPASRPGQHPAEPPPSRSTASSGACFPG